MIKTKIVSKNPITQFYCKRCKHATNIIHKDKKETWCEICVPKDMKWKTVDQNGKEIL